MNSVKTPWGAPDPDRANFAGYCYVDVSLR